MFNRDVSLDEVSIAAPCPVKWEEMDGDERKRFCSLCSLHVYNISEMKRKDAEAFLSENIDGVCIRLFRRTDGTLITKDCPVGRRLADAVKCRVRAAVVALVAMLNASAVFGQDSKLKVPDSFINSARPRAGVPWGGTAPTWPKSSVSSNSGIPQAKAGVREGAGVPFLSGEPAKLWKNDIEQRADTTAIDAFRAAQSHCFAKRFTEAALSYERAIKAFRDNRGKYDQKFEMTVVKEYAKLLRQQKNMAQANLIEKEFGAAK
ncbi:hypothetical protein BH11CYA1_BH11CYA1_41520 [soil metagenome]